MYQHQDQHCHATTDYVTIRPYKVFVIFLVGMLLGGSFGAFVVYSVASRTALYSIVDVPLNPLGNPQYRVTENNQAVITNGLPAGNYEVVPSHGSEFRLIPVPAGNPAGVYLEPPTLPTELPFEAFTVTVPRILKDDAAQWPEAEPGQPQGQGKPEPAEGLYPFQQEPYDGTATPAGIADWQVNPTVTPNG